MGLKRLGGALVGILEEAGRLFRFSLRLFAETIGFVSTPRRSLRLDGSPLLAQFDQIGSLSVPVVMTTALFTGMVLALQAGLTLEIKLKGVTQFMGRTVALPFIRELGPVLTGLIVTGRIGSAIAAEIGTMNVTEQIDALKTLATPPLRYLGVPRLLACLIMLPALTALANIVGLIGGFIVAKLLLGLPANVFWGDIPQMVTARDLVSGLAKTVFFGGIIAVVSCYQGFQAQGGAEGVGRATTKAVVWSSIIILISDYFLTAFFALFL
ncbi:MAG TPA: ABC transporter permease [bacterium]|jgi:phospholipid/cholesterol/gamma-HCH transport system permease protein|nr:ABC transporter permease [bacterium]